MEASRRERIVLYGAVPLASAIIGAIASAVLTRAFAGSPPSDAIIAVLKAPGLSPAERAKLLELATSDTTKFYSFLNTLAVLLLIPAGSIAWAIADWIKRH
jgi:hypothetical protein